MILPLFQKRVVYERSHYHWLHNLPLIMQIIKVVHAMSCFILYTGTPTPIDDMKSTPSITRLITEESISASQEPTSEEQVSTAITTEDSISASQKPTTEKQARTTTEESFLSTEKSMTTFGFATTSEGAVTDEGSGTTIQGTTLMWTTSSQGNMQNIWWIFRYKWVV